jgi:hypothetical protein
LLERRDHDTSQYAIRFNRFGSTGAPTFMGIDARGGGIDPPPLD